MRCLTIAALALLCACGDEAAPEGQRTLPVSQVVIIGSHCFSQAVNTR